jgi:hypothetical protein
MLNRYRRVARSAAEIGMGELRPLDEVVPELAALARKGGGKGGAGGSGGDAVGKSEAKT